MRLQEVKEDEKKHEQKADKKENDDKRKAERWNVTDSDFEN